MILFVGERGHDHNMSNQDVDQWYRRWTSFQPGLRTKCILSTPAMMHGETRIRLMRLVDEASVRIINLLWPDSKIGSWDEREALVSALHLNEFVEEVGTIDDKIIHGVALLGSRVAAAVALEENLKILSRTWCGVPAIVLPHPGCKTVRNVNDTRAKEILWEWKRFKQDVGETK